MQNFSFFFLVTQYYLPGTWVPGDQVGGKLYKAVNRDSAPSHYPSLSKNSSGPLLVSL